MDIFSRSSVVLARCKRWGVAGTIGAFGHLDLVLFAVKEGLLQYLHAGMELLDSVGAALSALASDSGR